VGKSRKKQTQKPRQSKIRIPLPFEQTVGGLLGLSQEDAKAVRRAAGKKKK
jgi:hypothetical protein